MIDIKFLRENPDVVKQNIKNKFQDHKLHLVDEVIDLDKITEASRIINKIMDEAREIEQDYDELDIYSKEKGDATNE